MKRKKRRARPANMEIMKRFAKSGFFVGCLAIMMMVFLILYVGVGGYLKQLEFEDGLDQYSEEVRVQAEFYCDLEYRTAWATLIECYKKVDQTLPYCSTDGIVRQACMENEMYQWKING